jgi:hypothetical protein
MTIELTIFKRKEQTRGFESRATFDFLTLDLKEKLIAPGEWVLVFKEFFLY